MFFSPLSLLLRWFVCSRAWLCRSKTPAPSSCFTLNYPSACLSVCLRVRVSVCTTVLPHDPAHFPLTFHFLCLHPVSVTAALRECVCRGVSLLSPAGCCCSEAAFVTVSLLFTFALLWCFTRNPIGILLDFFHEWETCALQDSNTLVFKPQTIAHAQIHKSIFIQISLLLWLLFRVWHCCLRYSYKFYMMSRINMLFMKPERLFKMHTICPVEFVQTT